ncbi:hypothetical protein D9M72_254710 [compost metagenome]
MHMPVLDLHRQRRAHVRHLQAELQRLAGPGVVAVEQHDRALDLGHGEDVLGAVVEPALQLAADLHAGRELGLGNGAHQRLVAQAEGVFGGEVQRGLVALFLAVERLLDLGQGVLVTAMQVGHRLGAGFDELALGVGDFVLEGDDGVFFDFHGGHFLWKSIRVRSQVIRARHTSGNASSSRSFCVTIPMNADTARGRCLRLG